MELPPNFRVDFPENLSIFHAGFVCRVLKDFNDLKDPKDLSERRKGP